MPHHNEQMSLCRTATPTFHHVLQKDYISKLPTEIHGEILSHVDGKSFAKAAGVNKYFESVVSTNKDLYCKTAMQTERARLQLEASSLDFRGVDFLTAVLRLDACCDVYKLRFDAHSGAMLTDHHEEYADKMATFGRLWTASQPAAPPVFPGSSANLLVSPTALPATRVAKALFALQAELIRGRCTEPPGPQAVTEGEQRAVDFAARVIWQSTMGGIPHEDVIAMVRRVREDLPFGKGGTAAAPRDSEVRLRLRGEKYSLQGIAERERLGVPEQVRSALGLPPLVHPDLRYYARSGATQRMADAACAGGDEKGCEIAKAALIQMVHVWRKETCITVAWTW